MYGWLIFAFIVFFSFLILLHFKLAKKNKTFAYQGLDSIEVLEARIKKNKYNSKKKKFKRRRFKWSQPQQQNNNNKVLNNKVCAKKTCTSKGEEMCRSILEKIFGCEFKSVRPSFLKNPVTKKNLELDCYNPNLKLALEYDGAQHSKYTPVFHGRDKWNFIYQVRKDDFKSKKCKENGITLIRIPHYIPHHKLESYIREKLKKENKL